MKLKKLVSALQELFEGNGVQDPKRAAALRELVTKLEKKEAKLRGKLKAARSDDDRAKYKRKLKIVQAQQKKGTKALAALSS